MKYLISFLAAFVLCFFISSAQALEASQAGAQKYGVTFPVEELGNCVSLSECRSFCDDPLNHDACIAFAKKKGFYKENRTAIKNAIAIAARSELGCENEEVCKAFCSQQINWQKCGEFAKKHNLGGGQTEDPAKKEILSKAKEILGCDSLDSCKGFCTKQENRLKCDEFAKLIGLRGGVEQRGPGGCTSLETCKAYCIDTNNSAECSKFNTSSGGMNKEEYCMKYPEKCRNATASGGLTYPTPNPDYATKCVNYGCSWTGTSCNCQNKTPFPGYSPNPTYTPYPSASSTSGSCERPVNGCGAYYAWDLGSCSCKSYADYCKLRGGTWTGTTCSLNTTSTYSSPTPTASYSTTTSGNTGTTSSVKGISEVRNFFQHLLDYLR